MKVYNMLNGSGNKVNNQFIIESIKDGSPCKEFRSYVTPIAEWHKNSLRLSSYWHFSKTTLKYLCLFINTYTVYEVSGKKDIQDLVDSGKVKVDIEVES